MSYVLAFLGFAALIILHEAGHFAAAKAVGMRVERFSLFFGPMILKRARGETEYGIGVIPLGGYVKITGMNPREEMPDAVRPRAYYNQAVWKRIVVILAGPVVNIVIAFVIVWILLLSHGEFGNPINQVGAVVKGTPAAAVLRAGDALVAVDGRRGSPAVLRARIDSHRCAGSPVNGCEAASPLRLTIRRAGVTQTVSVRPRYVAAAQRMELGFEFALAVTHPGPLSAAGTTVSDLASVTGHTVSTIVRIFEPQVRRQLHGTVGVYEATQQSFSQSTSRAFEILALISLSLGIVNLFPFLPLDGGHIFWALAEKARGRRISFAVMERAGVVGFVLIIMLFFVGLSNDVSTLSSGGSFISR